MNVADHRPPLKRIDIGQRFEVDKRRDITEAPFDITPAERDRIWRTVEQVAQGVGAPAEQCSADAQARRYLEGEV